MQKQNEVGPCSSSFCFQHMKSLQLSIDDNSMCSVVCDRHPLDPQPADPKQNNLRLLHSPGKLQTQVILCPPDKENSQSRLMWPEGDGPKEDEADSTNTAGLIEPPR
ncbi:unnamed protein product [Pleuronectes platessa]|uniref:Uncharacterized protein n=1 Tax=Pleuronectes platessa TaxID=8262 RepID=A0A9N7U604_PLEPL|nr:unnamed protein product [Pleuronectes platessa]